MYNNTETYYINENENVFDFLADKNISLSANAIKQLSFISKKTANNYIGYYQFFVDGKYVKFFVIPKIYKDKPENEKEKYFTDFLTKYYQLQTEYKQIRKHSINQNIVDLSFHKEENTKGLQINDFIQQKYYYAVDILEHFFRKHIKPSLLNILLRDGKC